MNTNSLVEKNLLVKMYAGSIAYGTNLPTSDVDFRGIFCGDPVNIRTPFFPVREYVDSSEEDTKYFELLHFMKLVVDCNPNIVELLWTDDADIVYRTPAYDKLREHRRDLLSSKIAFTTSGYAMAQLKRIKGHNKWIVREERGMQLLTDALRSSIITADWIADNIRSPIADRILKADTTDSSHAALTINQLTRNKDVELLRNSKPEPVKYVSLVQWFGKDKLLPRGFDLRNFENDYRLISFGGNNYGLYDWPNFKTFNADGSLNHQHDPDQLPPGAPSAIVKFNKEEWKISCDNYTNFWNWKKNRNEHRSDLEVKFGYDCYSDDTEFLTDNGWKLFDDVKDTDNIATFNSNTHIIEYQSPTERIESSFTGIMYHFLGQNTDTLVTSNHRMYIRPCLESSNTNGDWGFHRAAELPKTFDSLRRAKPIKRAQNILPGFEASILDRYNMLDYLTLLGWYISSGAIEFCKNAEPKSMKIINQSDPESKFRRKLTRMCSFGRLECCYSTQEIHGSLNYLEHVWTFDKQTAEWLYTDCGDIAAHKRLPQWSYSLTKREMTTLLISLLRGNGFQSRAHEYCTTNELLAGDIQRLAVLCGYETSLRVASTPGTYVVNINMRSTQCKRSTRDQVVKIPVKNKRVVCFMVPNLTLITRRNGQVSFHGNTKHAMHLVRLLRMGLETLNTGEIIVKRSDATELLDIRAGALSYSELLKYAEYMDKQIKVAYNTTKLNKRPNLQKAGEILMNVQDLIWNDNIK